MIPATPLPRSCAPPAKNSRLPVAPGPRALQKRVVVAVFEYGEFPEMLRVADGIRCMGGLEVLVFFASRDYRTLQRDSAEVVGHGFAWVDWAGQLNTVAYRPVAPARARPQDGAERPLGLWHSALHGVKRHPIGDFLALGLNIARFRRRYGELHRLLAGKRPSLIVVGQDFLGGELSFLLIAARQLGIASLIAPFAMFNASETKDYARSRPELKVKARLINRLLARLYPRWTVDDGEQAAVRLPGQIGLALEWTGLVHGDPWVPCSEPVDAIACESVVAANALAGMGIAGDRLIVVGKPVHDRLAASMHTIKQGPSPLVGRYKLDANIPLVVCGWPADVLQPRRDRRSNVLATTLGRRDNRACAVCAWGLVQWTRRRTPTPRAAWARARGGEADLG